jgi:uncharacterized membrane protein YfcA
MGFWLIPLVVFLAIFTQSAAGFGMALVAMPLLAHFFDIKLLSPLIALVGIIAKILLLMKYKQALDLRALWQLTVGSLLFVPIGVFALDFLDETASIKLLGVVVLFYAIYGLLNFTLPKLENNIWGFGFGAVAGFLGGAFNASGPPVVIYANTKRWLPDQFKGNLQAYSLVNGIFIAVNHYLNGNITPAVWGDLLIAIPAILLGVWLGTGMDRFFNPKRFRRMVLWLLVVLGIRMVFFT